MIGIIFEHQLDDAIPKPYPQEFYDKVREFYLRCYSIHNDLIQPLEDAGLLPIMVLRFTDIGIEAVPLDMPSFTAQILHATITEERLKKFKAEVRHLCPDRK